MRAKKNKNLDAKDLGFEKDGTIYINHDLTTENQRLYKRVREVKRSLNYKYAWVSHGNIYLRKTDNSKPICVTSEQFLDALIQGKN